MAISPWSFNAEPDIVMLNVGKKRAVKQLRPLEPLDLPSRELIEYYPDSLELAFRKLEAKAGGR